MTNSTRIGNLKRQGEYFPFLRLLLASDWLSLRTHRRFLDEEFTDLIDWYRAEHNASDNCELWAVVHAEKLRNAVLNARDIDES